MELYKFGGWVVENNVRTFYHVRLLDSSEFKSIEDAIGVILQSDKRLSLYRILQDNYQEIINYWTTKEEELKRTQIFNLTHSPEVIQEVDRRVSNYLSSFTTFINHWGMRLQDLKDANTENQFFNIFKDKTSFHYDSSFSYRFLWKLRNYVQHCGTPSTILRWQNDSATLEDLHKSLQKYNPSLENVSASNQEFKLSVHIDRDDLVATKGKKKVWSRICEELMHQPKEIDIIFHIIELNKCVEDINLVCTSIELLLIENSQSLLLEKHFEIQKIVQNSYSGILIQPSEFDLLNSYVGKRVQFKEMTFPLLIMKYLEDFRDHIAERCTNSSPTGTGNSSSSL